LVGFRNVAIPDYQSLNLVIVQAIIEKHLTDLLEFARLGWASPPGPIIPDTK
jgi:uncharacterized protein YutE (UPF0331/DUF86 family)